MDARKMTNAEIENMVLKAGFSPARALLLNAGAPRIERVGLGALLAESQREHKRERAKLRPLGTLSACGRKWMLAIAPSGAVVEALGTHGAGSLIAFDTMEFEEAMKSFPKGKRFISA
jgi:hypothetical protein